MRKGIAIGIAAAIAAVAAPAAMARAPRVLLVGTYHGIPGKYRTIQGAVDAARPGDYILVGPGDYHERADHLGINAGQPAGRPAGVVIGKSDVWIRGMNRNTVIVDGTKPGSPACSAKPSNQDFGLNGSENGKQGPLGRNGILIWKANKVWVQNLTVCNFLNGLSYAGNEIWWNGGDGSSTVGGYGYVGSYLTATSTFYSGDSTAAQYGIFSSNWSGGLWDHDYTSNFADSGFYIGACQQICNQTINHAWSEYSSLGYSGSNSGGRLLVENSQFDKNKDGFDTNSQNGDNPPPQNGACPAGVRPPVSGAPTCWVFTHNYVHDNNDPNVPEVGASAEGPVGTGMSLSGARNDTLMNNRFANNDAWGVFIVPFPDSGPPCTGGTLNSPFLGSGSCLYDDWGNALINNRFSNEGSYRNPTNGDFAQLNLESHPSDCYRGNTDSSGHLSTTAANLQQTYPTCTTTNVSPNVDVSFLDESLCDTGVSLPPFGCQPGDHYPRRTTVVMHRLPKLATMPNPCAGIPANPWCPAHRHRA